MAFDPSVVALWPYTKPVNQETFCQSGLVDFQWNTGNSSNTIYNNSADSVTG